MTFSDYDSSNSMVFDRSLDDEGLSFVWLFFIVFFVVVVVGFVFHILIPVGLFLMIRQRDHELPSEQRWLTDLNIVIYWGVCFFFSFVGACVMYAIATENINRKIDTINKLNMDDIPFAVAEEAIQKDQQQESNDIPTAVKVA